MNWKKSRTANENYERDKQRLAELYASKRIEALREESRQEMEIYKEVLQAANASALSDASVNSDAASAELLKISQEHETTVQGIEERWQKLADTFLSLNTTQKEAFISALKEQQIAFEETESGQLDFHKQILEDKLNADKAYEEARLEYYTQCKDIQANIDEAYRALDMERLQGSADGRSCHSSKRHGSAENDDGYLPRGISSSPYDNGAACI